MNSNISWLRTRSSKSKNIQHLIFVTKYRRKVFTDSMLKYCERLMRESAIDIGADILEFGGESDHVHLMVQIPPALSTSKIVKNLKGTSSIYLRKHHWPHVKQYLWGKHFLVAVLLLRVMRGRINRNHP